jgi:hypothetical protein
MPIDMTALKLPSGSQESPRQILETDFPACGSIPISGGWGYNRKDCVIIDKNDPSVPTYVSFDGVALEYLFVEKRIYEELIIFRDKKNQYSGIEWNLLKQELISDENNWFDYLSFEVTALPDSDWEYLKKDWENINQLFDSEDRVTQHQDEREKRTVRYIAEYWFEISSFYGVS